MNNNLEELIRIWNTVEIPKWRKESLRKRIEDKQKKLLEKGGKVWN